MREHDCAAFALRIGEALVGGIAVGLQHAGKVLEQPLGMLGAAPRRVAVNDGGRRDARHGRSSRAIAQR
jgi:hypothetical protein